MSKRILSALLAVLFLITGLPSTVWAVGEGNMEAGGGQTETVTGDSFWNGQWGIRFCVVDVVSQSVVSATYDASNYGGLSNYWHYGKTNKFDYRNGTTLTIRQGNYTLETPAVSIPTIVRTSGAPDIKAIKNYFTDETVIRWISDVTGMAYDTLINGDYKLFIEPILYFTFDGQKYAMTATEAALFDRNINGLLLRTLGNATHQQLPLALYLEKSDLGFTKWSGAKTGIQNDTNIINYLGMGNQKGFLKTTHITTKNKGWKSKMLNLETMDTSVLVAVISAIVSISAAIISLCGIRHHEIVTSMTKSRITWIKDVRELITDFCIQFYFLPNEKAQLERLRMHIFLYLRECNEFYTPLIKAINVCCDNHIGEKDVAVVLQDLVAASQYVLATAWARVKLEGAHGMSDDKRIDKQLKKKYTVPQPNYCPDNQKTNQ